MTEWKKRGKREKVEEEVSSHLSGWTVGDSCSAAQVAGLLEGCESVGGWGVFLIGVWMSRCGSISIISSSSLVSLSLLSQNFL